MDFCMHGIMCLNLDRNCEVLRAGRFIYQVCKDVRMVIICQSKVRIDLYLGWWPEGVTWGAV